MKNSALNIKRYELSEPFGIARGFVSHIDVVEVSLQDKDGLIGRGECRPYPRYQETPRGVADTVQQVLDTVSTSLELEGLLKNMPSGAVRNVLASALWDLQLKQQRTNCLKESGLEDALGSTLMTAETVGLGTPDEMAMRAARLADAPLLKVKLKDEGIQDSLRAVRDVAPTSRIIVDANEAWTLEVLKAHETALMNFGVEMIEQPLPAGDDAGLESLKGYPIPIVADESLHGAINPAALKNRYQGVNIKLDKAGGPDRAARQMALARDAGLAVMVGCMVSSSLAIVPAIPLALQADWVDLDGPRWLARDIDGGFSFTLGRVNLSPPWVSGGDWRESQG